jgi:ClpP class serine protease
MVTQSMVAARVWALEASAYRALVEAAAAGGLRAAAPGPRMARRGSPGSVAVVPVRGYIGPRASWLTTYFGGTSLDALVAEVRRAVPDRHVEAVVLDVDSPVGDAQG